MKKRNPNLTHPRKPKLVREWSDEATGWDYALYQKPSGSYMLLAYEIDGDNWKIESGDTIKACLAAAKVTAAVAPTRLRMTLVQNVDMRVVPPPVR